MLNITLLTFFVIFEFKIVGGITSSILALGIMSIYSINHPNVLSIFSYSIQKKGFLRIVFCYFVLCLWILLILLINQTDDFTFFSTLVHGAFQLVNAIMLYSIYLSKGYENKITQNIVVCFVIQSIIEALAFVFPKFKTLVLLTKDKASIDKMSNYMGIRGLALSGYDAFGLALGFTLVFLLIISPKFRWYSNYGVVRIGSIVFLIFGGIVAARTSIIGLGFSIMVFCIIQFSRIKYQKFEKQKIIKGCISVAIVAGVIILFVKNVFLKMRYSSYYIFYMFEGVINMMNTGHLSMTSTNNLFDNMYFDIPLKTLLVGDGRYSGDNGGYYMNTDAGYMRPVLFMGIMGLLLLIMITVSILKVSKKRLDKFDVVILIMALFLQIKGEVVGYAVMFNTCLMLYSLQECEIIKSEVTEKVKNDCITNSFQ